MSADPASRSELAAFMRSLGMPDPLDMVGEMFGEVDEVTVGRKSKRNRGYLPWTPRKRASTTLGQVLSIFAEYEGPAAADLPPGAVHDDGPVRPPEGHRGSPVLRPRPGPAGANLIPFEWVRDDNIVTYSSPWYEGQEGFWDQRADGSKLPPRPPVRPAGVDRTLV